MNTKLIIAAAALAVSMGTATTFANAGAPGLCAIGTTCTNAQPGFKALGRVKPAPVALGRVKITPEPAACVRARDAVNSNPAKVPLLVKICLAQGGNPNLPSAVELPPLVIGQPAPAQSPLPASMPSGSNVDPGDYENASDDGISCGEGRSIVRHSGFRKVHAIDCSSDVFTYSAKKHDQSFKVFVNSDGYIVHVSNFSY